METILESSIFDNNKVIKRYTEDFKTSLMVEESKKIDRGGIRGLVKEIQLDGVYINVRDINSDKGYYIDVYHDFPLFKLHFEIEGSNRYTPFNTLSLPVYIPAGHYNLFYFPEVKGRLSYDTTKRKTLEIKFTERYIKKIIGTNFKNSLQDFGKAVSDNIPYKMWNQSMPITHELFFIISKILNCHYTDNIKKAFLEAQVTELLAVLFAKKNEYNREKDKSILSEVELAKVHVVESYIKENLRSNLTISKLASVGGLNTSKLKKDFKIAFSTTVFKYITTLRMNKAQQLIIENNYTITQASYEVGYKNPQHFTVAFKKMYGYLPSKLNKFINLKNK